MALYYFLLFLFLAIGVIWAFLSIPAAQLASGLSRAVPFTMIGLGALLTIVGRGGIGIPLAVIGFGLWRRMRGVSQIPSSGSGQKSTVRSAALEMELDHESGEMEGMVLVGEFEGWPLSQLDEAQLFSLYGDIRSDGESAALLEAYLDRRLPGWREDTQAGTGSGQDSTPGSGSMTKEEAYQVLGLEPGATPAEIRAAWRKLMKAAHPDSGGSEFLAARINMAKDVLLG